MNFFRFIGRFLAVFVIVGLVAAPLVTVAAAKHLPVTEMNDMSAMSADMPCCPDVQKNDGCRDCPVVAMCMLTIAQAEPSSATAILAPQSSRRLFFPLRDSIADGLIGVPPDHPPRTST